MAETVAATERAGPEDIFALHQINRSSNLGDVPFDVASWSRFKYGDAQVASAYGEALARLAEREIVCPALFSHSSSSAAAAQDEQVIAPLVEEEQFVVAVARHAGLPTAASMLAAHFTRHLRRLLLEPSSGITRCSGVTAVVAETVITRHRRAPYTVDYAALGAHDRRELLAAEKLTVDADAVRGRIVLVVDDIRTTGAHEAAVRGMFSSLRASEIQKQAAGERGGGPARVMFLYVARVIAGKHEAGVMDFEAAVIDPTIETRLNEAAIPTLVHLQGIVMQQRSGLVITSRFVKRVLGAPRDELVQLFDALAAWCSKEADGGTLASFQRALLDAANAGGMADVAKYSTNYRLLQGRVLQSLAGDLVVAAAPALQQSFSALASPLQGGVLPGELQRAQSLPC
ncbi:hypothetical protein GQ53DRAFT_769454 [Thozetella sp. PMI_491]|nr:hypothetical protein GQ53DRAFT_769454 [Thozetella sp. PMI_491]